MKNIYFLTYEESTISKNLLDGLHMHASNFAEPFEQAIVWARWDVRNKELFRTIQERFQTHNMSLREGCLMPESLAWETSPNILIVVGTREMVIDCITGLDASSGCTNKETKPYHPDGPFLHLVTLSLGARPHVSASCTLMES